MKNYLKRTTTFFLALLMLVSVPLQAFAQVNHEDLTKDKGTIINESKLKVQPAKLENGQTAKQLIENPAQPAIYTLRTDYKVQKGEKYEIDYQPYIASVGAAAKDEEKAKVNKEITLPNLAGYDKSHLEDTYKIDYKTVKETADGKNKTGDVTNGIRYSENQDFRYKAKSNDIKIKHLFQDMSDFTKYTNPGGADKPEKITTQNGNTGSTMEVSPLNENDRRGFIPEAAYITMQVPEDATDFVLEYRYNRAHYNVDFDTMGGTPIATRTYYYDQEIPKIEKENIPTKIGCDFLGWKPSHDLQTTDGKTYKANQIINKADGTPALDLDVKLKMPALLLGKDEKSRERLKFTAVWKDKEKADYAIQFWVEKADHADNADILDKYDYMGTRVHKDADTGFKPNLDAEPVDKLKFPDLDQARLEKIWNGEKFYGNQYLYLNKFFVYNKDLTDSQNGDKTVSATGKTVYNIYYDRQVYDLYFTKSNALPAKNTFYPEIYVPDGNGGAKLAGGPGNPYHYTARFNQLMLGWPNDAMQTKGFDEGKQSYGWGPNYGVPNWPLHLDTPPYRLNADEFLDMPNYENWGGYVAQIDKGDGTYVDVNNDPRYKNAPYKALSFGIKQDKGSMPHHMDFWMDGFKDGETIIRYDLYRTKADTNSLEYGHKYSQVQGFTPYGTTIEEGKEEHGRITEDDIGALNEEREGITPLPDKEYMNMFGFNTTVGQMNFLPAFFNTTDDFGDPLDGVKKFETNGYIRFKYHRNKYPLRFNYDPSVIKDDSAFNKTNSLDTFFQFPLKVLNPELVPDNTPREDREYFKEKPKNFLDDPKNLQTLGLTDLVFTDKDGKLKVKRPEGLSDQMVFKGWALDPAGNKLIWENPKETMPNHPLNLYAKWGEPDYKWKVTFDPDGGKLKTIKEEGLTTERKKIQEGDIGQEEVNTYAKKGYLKEEPTTPDGKQIFTVIQRQKLVKPIEPVKKGYDFMGWEVIRYKKDAKGDYTDEVDTSYRDKYGVPELYTFGNDVVGPVYLKAIWNPNQRVDVKVVHHFLDKDCKKDGDPLVEFLENKRTGYYTATTGDKQGEKWILAPNDELINSQDQEIKDIYKKYNDNFGFNNTYFQNQRIEPEKIIDKENSTENETVYKDNPNYKGNEFHFFYRPFRQREYTVNYLDEKGKEEVEKFFEGLDLIKVDTLTDENEILEANQANKEKFEANRTNLDKILKTHQVVGPEAVTNGNRHYDARNFRPIPGWKLTSDAQQQLFFDLNEDTNEFLGINGTGSDQIFFYYKDVRVIEVPNKDDPVPDGYVRVTFKADKGGSFGKDAESKDITELNYDVIKGLKSDLLPVPKELAEGETADKDKHYITPETGKKFVKWDEKPLLNKNTILDNDTKDFYVFTAKFEWSGLTATGLVRTEAFKDDKADGTKDWSNNFAPTIDQLKAQLVWKEKDETKPLPAGTEIKLYDEAGKELTSDDQVYELVNEKKAADKDELVRTVNVKAKVTFKDGKEPQELIIPITVYKNVYEALTGTEKPLFLSQAEGKEAKDGGLKDVTGNYVKVTVAPTGDLKSKDNKVYYVNPKAWVEIPEVDTKDNPNFTNWTANKKAQNEKSEENGVYDFTKRHKFTEDTVISPGFSKDVVPQDGEDKPKVPDSYVKVIVDLTDKAKIEGEEKQTQTFWVNPTKEVTLPVTSPSGKEKQKVTIEGLGEKEVNYVFKEWQKVKAGEADDKLIEVKPAVKMDLAKNQFNDKVTVIEAVYKKSIAPGKIEEPLKTTKLDTPQGKEITNDDLIKKITPQEGKVIESIEVISKPDGKTVGNEPAKVIVKYKDGSTQGTNDNPVVIPVEVHKNIIPEAPGGQRPKDALPNYVKVIFKAGTGGSLSGDLVYYVSPEVEVDMTESAKAVTKTPEVGYIVNGEKWTNKDEKTLKGTFTDSETEFVFTFDKSKDIVEKIDDPDQVIPKDYVKVTFKTEDENKGKLEGDKLVKIYYVNPKAGITLKVLGKNETATDKQLAVPTPQANANYVFDKWQEAIDEITPITSERVHVAIFKSGQVTLTYNKGGDDVTGEVPTAATVNYGTTVGLAGKGTLAKPNATFAGWKLDGDETIYQPGDQVKLKKARTATAQWTNDKNIIPYNPEEPITRPEGYVRVTFAADSGLKLTEQKAYYVKANAGITLGNADLVKPKYSEDTGYKFDKWDKENTTVIETTDIVVTAKATKLDNVIPEKDGEGNPNTKPDGYKEITFVIKTDDAAKGSIDGVAKFYVNPTEYVTINPPATKAETGFEFGAWDKDATISTVYKEDATITGSFNDLEAVIPKTNPDGTENKKPDGYKTVTFEIEGQGGKIADKEVRVYYVNPAKEVTVPQPKTVADTGYEFDKWKIGDQEFPTEAKKYTADTTVKGSFTKLADIIPSIDPNTNKPNAKPEGYVAVTFDKGANGKSIEGQTVYYVNPKADPTVKLGDNLITKPKVTPETGYKFTKWDTDDNFEIKADKTVKATYEELKDVIPKTTNDDSEKPDGYITVTFVKGEHGKELTGQAVYYVNPNKAVVLKDKTPTAVPNTGYKFARWDVSIDQAIQYKDGAKITALYNEPGNISTTEVEGYVKVEFKPGNNGSLTGTTNYWIKPGVEVNVPAPTAKANVGYKFDKWDKSLTVTAKANDPTYEITAQYTPLADIIPQKNTDGSDKPDGYHTVTFKVVNGTTSGQTVFYVNGEKEIDLTDTANGISKKANIGYTDEGVNWSPAITNKKYTGDAEYTFTFKALPNVIEEKNGTTKPEGYVIVEFIAGANGSLKGGNKTYYVNPEKNITLGSTELPIPDTKPAENYKFDNWYEAIDKTEPIKKDKKFVARFILNKATMTYDANGATEGTAPEALSYDIGTEITIAGGNNLKKDNAVLTGWKIGDKTYKPGQKFTINADTIATAVWEAGLHTVEFDTDGAGYIPSQKVKHNELITPVTNPQKDDYFFTGWKIKGTDTVFDPTKDKVTKDITLVAQYSKDIIPQTGTDKPEGVPDNFVPVEFKEGTNGSLAGTTKYWVNPTAGKKLSDITHPSVTENDGWKHTGWDKTEDTEIKSQLDVTAQYLKKILTEEPTDNRDEYVRVEFKEGDHGTIAADATKAYWVLKNETVSLTVPTVTAKEGYAQKTNEDAWSPKLATSYSNDTTHIAQYVYNGENVIPQKGNDKPNNVPDDFVLVEFNQGAHGTIASTETTKYWVSPKDLVTLTPPEVKANSGYEQERGLGAWDKYLTGIFSKATTITAQYRKIEVPTPSTPGDPDNPDRPNPGYPGGPDYPSYPGRPIPMYPEVRYETIIQEKIVKVPVPVSDNYFKEVRYMQGFNGYFRPNDGLTRAEAAQILANALVEDGYKYNPNFKISYKDVGEAWYTRAVKIVTEAKVFAGYDDGNFKPQAKITRNEWIATLKRFQELGDASGNNMNLSDNHWAKAEIQAAFNEGWLKIYTDGLATYKGDEFIPRQEVAAVSNKAFKRIVDKAYIGKNNLGLITYKDVNTSMWAYEDILCASNTFLDRKDRYIAHWYKEDKNQFNIDTSSFDIVQKNFQRNPR